MRFPFSIARSYIKMANNSPAADLYAMRKAYKSRESVLHEDSLPSKNPFQLFHLWFNQVKQECSTILEPNAVCLATSNKNNQPSARMVLLKSYGPEGFKVFTNYESRKGNDLAENPQASLLFYWDALNRQIRIEGSVNKVTIEESVEYFKNRPRNSQLSALLSKQSELVDSRETLIERFNQLDAQHVGQVPRPESWGGYLVVPNTFEFWQGQSDRLHDRIRFRRLGDNEVVDGKVSKLAEDGWVYERMQP